MKILITSGGTRVPIDSVRHIANMSTGRYGAELADAFLDMERDINVLFSMLKIVKSRKIIRIVRHLMIIMIILTM